MVYRFNNFTGNLKDIVSREVPVEERDLTLENHGILGYTAADFQDAILGDSQQLKKLEVYSTEISEAATLVDTGLANLKVFTKTQLFNYKGTVTYTVDLGGLSKEDISLDEEGMKVHLKIPHAVQEEININENDIELGDVDRGLLGIGEISMTPEEQQKLQSEARNKMQDWTKRTSSRKQIDSQRCLFGRYISPLLTKSRPVIPWKWSLSDSFTILGAAKPKNY